MSASQFHSPNSSEDYWSDSRLWQAWVLNQNSTIFWVVVKQAWLMQNWWSKLLLSTLHLSAETDHVACLISPEMVKCFKTEVDWLISVFWRFLDGGFELGFEVKLKKSKSCCSRQKYVKHCVKRSAWLSLSVLWNIAQALGATFAVEITCLQSSHIIPSNNSG